MAVRVWESRKFMDYLVFVTLLSIFALTPAPIRAHFRTLFPHTPAHSSRSLLPFTPAHSHTGWCTDVHGRITKVDYFPLRYCRTGFDSNILTAAEMISIDWIHYSKNTDYMLYRRYLPIYGMAIVKSLSFILLDDYEGNVAFVILSSIFAHQHMRECDEVSGSEREWAGVCGMSERDWVGVSRNERRWVWGVRAHQRVSEREWARIGSGVSSKIDRRMTKARNANIFIPI
mgnify:CR=1 FL=1